MNIQAIETRFDGHLFRSRTEARWAVFFKEMGWKYQYEVEGYDLDGLRYLPDFFIAELDCWFEVKSEKPETNFLAKPAALVGISKKPCLIGIGPPHESKYNMAYLYYDTINNEADIVRVSHLNGPPLRFAFRTQKNTENVVLCLDGQDYCFHPPHHLWPAAEGGVWDAFAAASGARFEFGAQPCS